MKLLALLSVMMVFVSCGVDPVLQDKKTKFFDLRVDNQSEVDIYPVLLSEEAQKESFGVVGDKSSKTTAFGPFKISGKVTVAWEEGDSTKDTIVNIDMTPLLPIKEDVSRVSFIYSSNKKWHVECLDENGNIVVKSSIGRIVTDYTGSELVDFTPFVDEE